MMNPGISEEVGQTTRSFLGILKDQPLSLALVVMNFLIVAYLFYAGAQQLEQRAAAMEMIVSWSKETDKILGSCVSIETMKLVVDALERDRELYRRMIQPNTPPVAVPPPISEPRPPVPPPMTETPKPQSNEPTELEWVPMRRIYLPP
jgi:hypothetical protein